MITIWGVTVVIRPYQECDFKQLLEIDRVCFEPGIAYDEAALRYFLYHIKSFTLVLEYNAAPCGMGIAACRGKRGHIITLDLLPHIRRQGLGKELLTRLETWLIRGGATEAFLEVDERNTDAVSFYTAMGYKRVRDLRNYYGRGMHARQMAHRLQEKVLPGN